MMEDEADELWKNTSTMPGMSSLVASRMQKRDLSILIRVYFNKPTGHAKSSVGERTFPRLTYILAPASC